VYSRRSYYDRVDMLVVLPSVAAGSLVLLTE